LKSGRKRFSKGGKNWSEVEEEGVGGKGLIMSASARSAKVSKFGWVSGKYPGMTGQIAAALVW